MAETPPSPGRKPLYERSVNVEQLSDAVDVSTASSWNLFRKRSARKRSAQSEARRRLANAQSAPQPQPAVEAQHKLVVVLMPSPHASLTCFLTQVCGGPLESVFQFRSETSPLVLLEFVYACHAQRFVAYVRGGNCALHGRPVSIMEVTARALARMVDKVRAAQPVRQQAVLARERRTLHIYTPVALQPSGRWEPRPLRRSRLDMRSLMDVFGRLGHVLQVRPMIFQQSMAFAVDFDCIAAAVHAKTQFDREKRAAHLGGYVENPCFASLDGWCMEYTRDPTERACLF